MHILVILADSRFHPVLRQEPHLFSDCPQPGPRAALGRHFLHFLDQDIPGFRHFPHFLTLYDQVLKRNMAKSMPGTALVIPQE